MKLVGIMLTSALLIIPALCAFQAARSFRGTLIFAASTAVLSVWVGIFLSFVMNVPTGATIVLLNFAFFLVLYGDQGGACLPFPSTISGVFAARLGRRDLGGHF